jgi:salicylate hydroxylase
MPVSEPFLIAGGGIGGLALALALARRSRTSIVLERQPQFATTGAGIQIGPNGVRTLQALGIAEALRSFAGQPQGIVVRDGCTGRVLNRLPLGDWIARRHGAPYWVVHRSDLHRVLLDAAVSDTHITLRTGFDLASVSQSGTQVSAVDRSGATVTGEALIGADGLWSTVRRFLPGMPTPVFAGATATRTVISAEEAGPLAIPAVGLWLSSHAHVVHYPVRGGQDIAVVVIARESWQGRDWDAEADATALRAQVASFHPTLTDVLGSVAAWRKWALYTLAPLPAWSSGRIALLGDAAHPMLPYLAQGGAIALEDALVLAHCFGSIPDVPGAFAGYAWLRRARARHIQAASVRQGRIYRLPQPLSFARNLGLRLCPGALLMSRLDWIYGWTPPG